MEQLKIVTEEMLGYVCDQLCCFPSKKKKDLEAACAICRMRQFEDDILRLHQETEDLLSTGITAVQVDQKRE